MFHILLKNHHVVIVLFARHMNTQVPGHICLVITYVASPCGLRFASSDGLLGCRLDSGWSGQRRGSLEVLRRHDMLGLNVAVLQLLHVVDVLVRLHVNAEVALSCSRVVANLATIRFVTACIRFPTSQPGVGLIGETVHAAHVVLRMFFFHVNLQSLLVFVVPIAFGTFERLARIPRVHHGHVTAQRS